MSRQRCTRSAHYASEIRFLFRDDLHRPSVNVQCYRMWALQGLNLRPSSYELAAAYHLS